MVALIQTTMRNPADDDTPLPVLDAAYPLRDRDVASFQEKGHVHLRGVATPDEIARFAPFIESAASTQNRETRPLAERDTYGRAFLQTINLWLDDARVQAFVFAKRFAAIAARLLGVPRVQLYHDQALFKEPQGGATPWHQDQYYWPLDTQDTITLWMPLAPVPPEIGGMHFASGSHQLGHLGDFAIGDQSQEVFEALIEERNLPVEKVGQLEAGDATFHHGWTLHCAGPNPTASMRAVMTIIYFREGARVAGLDHPARRFDRAMYLPGCQEGDLAAGDFCPQLHPRESHALPPPPVRDEAYWKSVIAALGETRS